MINLLLKRTGDLKPLGPGASRDIAAKKAQLSILIVVVILFNFLGPAPKPSELAILDGNSYSSFTEGLKGYIRREENFVEGEISFVKDPEGCIRREDFTEGKLIFVKGPKHCIRRGPRAVMAEG